MNGRRNFLLATILAGATGALGQALPPTAGPAGAVDATAIPDFSGIWSHPSFPGFEPPASGPGPVVNTVRRLQGNFDGRVLPPKITAW